MESVSRPPHRRKHSATTNAFSSSTFSFKNPYDGVLLSNAGERKSLEAHEYTEIFSGPSAIPVLDLSGLDERVGSDDPRSSKLDYSNIFGGLRNDDVAVPYHELFNGSAKKIKPRISSDTPSPLQESSSLHSSGKTKTSSAEASDQSVDGVKQQFNLSFNRTSQRNSDAPNGKTHIAELHAVPGFTYFVDGGNPQKTENDRRAPSLKREVSRTWSFAAKVEAVKGKGGLSPEKSHTPDDKSHNVNEVNLKSSFPSRTSDSKNPMKSSASNFSLEDASEKVVGESSPPFFGEEFDENSVAALSAAALKKAIDQAQESIRIAKMIMEKKREGFQDGHKRRPKSHVKVLEKEAKIYRDAYGSEENNAKEQFEELNPGVTGNDGKSNQSYHHNEKFIDAANVDMERVWENVGTAKEHGETSARGGKLFASDCSRSKTVYIDERVEVKNLEENVYAAETHREVSNNSSKETLEVAEIIGDNKKGSIVVAEQVEKSAEEAEQCEDTFDHAEGSEKRVERVLDASHRTREQEKVVDEAGEKLRICQADEVSDQRVNDVDDKGKCEKKFDDYEEMLNVEDLTVLRSKFDSFMDESCNRFVNRILEQEDMEKKSESVFESKEDDITYGIIYNEEGMMQEEAPICVESEEQVRDALEEEKNERKAHAFAERGETEKKVNEAYEPEIDNKKQNHVHDGDGRNIPGQLEQNTSEYGEAEPIVMEAKNYADIKSAEELDNNLTTKIQESADKDDIDEAIDVNSSGASTIFNDTHTTDATSPILNTNEAEQYQKAVKNYKENDTSPDIIGTFAATDKDYESEQPSHLQDNEMRGRDALNRSASGEIFVESVGNAFEGLSVDGKIANTEEKPAEDDNVFKITSKIHDASQEYDAKIVKQNLPEVHASDIGTAEFDLKDVGKVLEQTSETNEESLSNSNLENIDGLSAHEPEECAENAEDKTSNEEGLEDEIEMVSNERKCDEELSVESYPHLHTEPKETEKSTEAARAAERDLNMEKNKEDLLANERNDHLQRIEAIKKGREREKDRLVVERAIREARERAFAEARERAERAAVEKAAAEVRQRVLAEAREKFEKSSVKQTVDKASTEAKRRTERAAVERATAEARSRALEKAMSQKTYTDARTPSSSGSNDLKHSFSSSDLENGANTESAQRRKARLERHQRIMERAAKALEEKNMRDLLVQKEQAERDRLSESLNADIKRWAAGKEGNLRALLSTLQYILGPDSSWQPISLTEIITTAAVKKAYRKATLYVHPDKLQQRGATIQQKYICEKVFDLLKAAWNRFNSDER